MSLKDYIQSMQNISDNVHLNMIFADLLEDFFPKPKPSPITYTSQTYLPKKSYEREDNMMVFGVCAPQLFDKRKIAKKCDNKQHSDLYFPDGQLLEFAFISSDGRIFYTFDNKWMFVREQFSRFINIIDDSNYDKYADDVEFLSDYAYSSKVYLEVAPCKKNEQK